MAVRGARSGCGCIFSWAMGMGADVPPPRASNQGTQLRPSPELPGPPTETLGCPTPGSQLGPSVSQRLASAAGHIKGVERMVDDNAYCIDVIKQIQAVQAALNKVNTIILDNHLRTCVTTAIQGDDAGEREAVLEEITSVFTMTSK